MVTSNDVSFGQAMSGPYSSLVVFRTKEGLWLESENVMVFEPQFPSENKKLQNGNGIGGLQPISRDTDNNAAMYNCWWTNKRS